MKKTLKKIGDDMSHQEKVSVRKMSDEIMIVRNSPDYKKCPQGHIHVISMETMRANNGRHEYFVVEPTTHAEMAIKMIAKDRKAYEEVFGHRQKKNYQILLRRLVRWLKGH